MNAEPYTSRLDLSSGIRHAVLPLLQARLTETLDLFARLKQAHWNVKGSTFMVLHELFDRLAEEVEEASDEIAERIVAFGGVADGRVQTTARDSPFPEMPGAALDAQAALLELAGAISAHGQALRANIDEAAAAGDAGTSDLFTALSRQCDKQLWFIEAHLARAVT